MNQTNVDYFAKVQIELVRLGQNHSLTADESDVIDDYELQEFSAEACAADIAKRRE